MVADEDKTGTTQQTCSFSIEQVSAQTGLTKRTLRYYEEVGLLPPTGRTEGNYRRYSPEDIQRLERIKSLRNLLGFSLAEVRTMLEVEDERQQIQLAYCQETDVDGKIAQLDHADILLSHQLQLIEEKIAGLEQMRASLLAKIERHKQTRQQLCQQKDI